MKSLSFFVAGIPKGQPRPRAFARKMGNRFVARVYDDGTAENWKSQIAVAFKQAGGIEAKIEGPVSMQLSFRFPRPKSHFRSNGELKPNAPRYHVVKPDSDNCEKAVMDALTQLGVWRDDSQVCIKTSEKIYTDEPGAQILVAPFEQPNQRTAP